MAAACHSGLLARQRFPRTLTDFYRIV